MPELCVFVIGTMEDSPIRLFNNALSGEGTNGLFAPDRQAELQQYQWIWKNVRLPDILVRKQVLREEKSKLLEKIREAT